MKVFWSKPRYFSEKHPMICAVLYLSVVGPAIYFFFEKVCGIFSGH
jgi:hypothetical protein